MMNLIWFQPDKKAVIIDLISYQNIALPNEDTRETLLLN